MSDISLRDRPVNYPGHVSLQLCDRSPFRSSVFLANPCPTRTLASLPFDVLLAIAEYLDPDDVWNLGKTCKSLHSFAESGPIWRRFALAEHTACRPLPLKGFERLRELNTRDLAKLVIQGRRLYRSWSQTGPKLIKPYTHVSAPWDEDVVWQSLITSRYALCCTKSGKVLCYDVLNSKCVAEWCSGADWEVWKCRVESDERTVYFAMAKRAEDGFRTDCQLMALRFPCESDSEEDNAPCFTKLSSFCFPGHVIGVYLLDPLRRVTSAFLWLRETNRLALFVLLDWLNPRYVFLDSGIFYGPLREWSCLGYDPDNVVIHAEEDTRAYQYYYPASLLQSLSTSTLPTIRARNPPLIPPPRQTTMDFIPTENPFDGKYLPHSSHFVRQWWQLDARTPSVRRRSCTVVLRSMTVPHPDVEGPIPIPGPDDPPPGTHLFTIAQHYFSVPLRKEFLRWWYVRDPFEIVCYPYIVNGGTPEPDVQVEIPMPEEMQLQHVADGWEDVPLDMGNDDASDSDVPEGDAHVHPHQTDPAPHDENQGAFEIADHNNALAHPLPIPPIQDPPILNEPPDPNPDPNLFDPLDAPDDFSVVPLLAVDFGFAVWLEYTSFNTEDLRLRYVAFPPVDENRNRPDYNGFSKDGDVRTLEVPPEIDLRRVVHLGLDQAQGTIILGMRRTDCYILRYA